jgi:hypothetical protein
VIDQATQAEVEKLKRVRESRDSMLGSKYRNLKRFLWDISQKKLNPTVLQKQDTLLLGKEVEKEKAAKIVCKPDF